MNTKKARPSTATGNTPNTMDSGLVVTAPQLITLFDEQASVVLPVKCSMVM